MENKGELTFFEDHIRIICPSCNHETNIGEITLKRVDHTIFSNIQFYCVKCGHSCLLSDFLPKPEHRIDEKASNSA